MGNAEFNAEVDQHSIQGETPAGQVTACQATWLMSNGRNNGSRTSMYTGLSAIIEHKLHRLNNDNNILDFYSTHARVQSTVQLCQQKKKR